MKNSFYKLEFKWEFNVCMSFIFQTQQNKFVNWQGDAEMRGEDFTATVTLGNPDVLVGSGRSSFNPDTIVSGLKNFIFLNAVTSLVCLKVPPLPTRCRRSTLLAVHNASSGSGRGAGVPPQARGGGLRHVAGGKIHRSARHLPGCGSFSFCLYPRCSQSIPLVFQVATTSPRWLSARPELTPRTTTKRTSRWDARLLVGSFQVFFISISLLLGHNWPSASSCQLSVGVEFEASNRMQDTSVSFGYQLDVPKANLQFKGKGCFLLSW